MADNNIETRVNELERRTIGIEAKIDAFIQSNEDFKRTMRETMADFKNEMRQQNEMRAAEIRELRAKQDADINTLRQENNQTVARIESKINQIETKIDSVNQYAHQMFLAAAIGIAAMVITVIASMVYTANKNDTAHVPTPPSTPAIHTTITQQPIDEIIEVERVSE